MKKFVALMLALILALSVCAVASAGEAKKKVGIAMPTKSLERWNSDGEYLEKQFQDAGVTVLTFDADAPNDARSFYVNQATAMDIAVALVDVTAKGLEEEGFGADQTARLALISGSGLDVYQNFEMSTDESMDDEAEYVDLSELKKLTNAL